MAPPGLSTTAQLRDDVPMTVEPHPAGEDRAEVVPLRRASVVPDEAIEEPDGGADPTGSDDSVPVVDFDAGAELTTAPTDELAALTEQAVRVVAGLAISAVSLSVTTLRRSLGADDGDRADAAGTGTGTSTSSLLTGAVLGAAAEGAIVAGRIGGTLAGRLARAAQPAAGPVRQAAEVLDARWRRYATDAEDAADRAAASAVPEVARAALERLDLTALVIDHVDLNEVAAGIDPALILERVDVDAFVDRLDLDAMLARVDIDAVIDRVDLAALARDVIDELDLTELIRESAGGLTGESVEGVRIGTASADRAIARAIDRVLRRRDRDLHGPGEPS